MKRIPGFDIAKFVLAYFVVAIHCGVGNYSIVIESLLDLAVPVFFIISGFLNYKYIYGNGEFSHYMRRMFRMYFIYVFIYLPLTIKGVRDLPLSEAVIDIFQGIFIIGENYYSWPLWFLWALIWGIFIAKGLSKIHVNEIGLLIIGFLLTLLAKFMIALHPLHCLIESRGVVLIIDYYFTIFVNTRNGLFTAFPCLALGFFLARNGLYLKNRGMRTLVVVCMGGVILYGLNIPYSMQLLAFIIVLMLLQMKCTSQSPILEYLRDMSTLLFFFHMFVLYVWQKSSFHLTPIQGWLFVSIITTLITSILCVLSKRYKMLSFFYK